MGIRIKEGGVLTTVQDSGRVGFQSIGISVTGATDLRAYELGNLLVGNETGEAGLETTMAGLSLEFLEANTIAITGGDMKPKLNEKPVAMYRAIEVKKGDVLAFTGMRSGFRSYIAFAGGLDVPLIYGSRSTHLRCQFGGKEGRRLQAGDEIGFLSPKSTLPGMSMRFVNQEQYPQDAVLRVVMGPQDDYFSEEGIRTFLSEEYTTTRQMDRLGARLSGPAIEHSKEAGIISDGVAFGSIQVPGNGQPIIMLADRQSTGGYTKIASVISADIPFLAQLMPGRKVRFQKVSVSEAQDIYLKECEKMQEVKWQMENAEVLEEKRRNELAKGEIDFDKVRELVKEVSDSALTGFEISKGDLYISMSKEREGCSAKREDIFIQPAEEEQTSLVERELETEGNLVKSPFVGTFYEAGAPNEPPFVKIGDQVKKGQTLCIVEAMKLMNEVKSEYDGVIAEILVKNEETVEYGQTLFVIQ